MGNDLEKIKKHYGENFAKLCRNLFSTILEEEGKLYEIISKYFAPSKSIYNDIVNKSLTDDFKNYVYSKFHIYNKEKADKRRIESPYNLMKKAGYKLYRCETNEDVLSYKRYWQSDEELCTFRDPERIDTHIIFFAVKDDVKKINRKDFLKPLRQDKYGTSVISIQFSKGAVNSLSIKNRYNHTVCDPDATFSNDLENIYPGLTESFVKECNLNLSYTNQGLEIPGYITDINGKFYRYNLEINNNYYCENNVVVNQDRIAKQYNKDRYELIEQFLLDKQEKVMVDLSGNKDALIDLVQDIQKISILKDDNNKDIFITTSKGEQRIKINKHNEIIGYENINVTNIGRSFLSDNKNIEEIKLPNVREIGDLFLYSNKKIKQIEILNVNSIGNYFLSRNNIIEKINLPNVTQIGDDFLYYAENIKEVDLPNVREIGDGFLQWDKHLEKIAIPNVQSIGNNFLFNNTMLSKIYLPLVKKIGDDFLSFNKYLKEIEIQNVKEIGQKFLYNNRVLEKIIMPNVTEIGDRFLVNNIFLNKIVAPKVTYIGNYFLYNNECLEEVSFPNLKHIGFCRFSNSNKNLSYLIDCTSKGKNKMSEERIIETKSENEPNNDKTKNCDSITR